jgi:hypothetical protein
VSDVLRRATSFARATQEVGLDGEPTLPLESAALPESSHPGWETPKGTPVPGDPAAEESSPTPPLSFHDPDAGGPDRVTEESPTWGSVDLSVDDALFTELNLEREEETAQSNRGSRRAGPVLRLLASGTTASDPAALLGGEVVTRLLAQAAESYDVVLIDSPAFLAVSDAIPLATAVEGVVVVTRPDFTTRDAAERFRRVLDRLPQVRVLGLVANGIRRSRIAREDHPAYYA